MEEWLGARVGSSRCCSVCGESECRTVEVGAGAFEAVPEVLFSQSCFGRFFQSCWTPQRKRRRVKVTPSVLGLASVNTGRLSGTNARHSEELPPLSEIAQSWCAYGCRRSAAMYRQRCFCLYRQLLRIRGFAVPHVRAPSHGCLQDVCRQRTVTAICRFGGRSPPNGTIGNARLVN
jgi:hypothetical protein